MLKFFIKSIAILQKVLYNIVKVKIYLQINKKGCVYLWQKWQKQNIVVRNTVANVPAVTYRY